MNFAQDIWRYCKLASNEPKDKSDPLLKDCLHFDFRENDKDYGFIADFPDRVLFVPRETKGLFEKKERKVYTGILSFLNVFQSDQKFTPHAWFSDLNTFDITETKIGTLHKGFYDGWMLFEEFLLRYIWDNVPAGKPIILGGYSRGGAIVQLAGAHVAHPEIGNRPCSVISFGAPAVGKSDFRDTYEKLPIYTTRVIHDYDLVPNVPLWDMGFRRAGPEVHLKGKWIHKYRPIMQAADHACYDEHVNKWEVACK